MHIRRVRAADGPIRRYMEELWLPYRRELGEVAESQGLSSEFDIETEIEWHIDRFETADSRLWVALDDVDDSTTPLEEIDATFAGFISVDLETAPSAFDWPDRLVVGDFYVRELYRGAGLADQLVARAVQSAREDGCEQLALEVDIDNERALAYYEKLGFEVGKYRMRVPVEELELDV